MALAAKGEPVIAVAGFYGAPRILSIVVAYNSPIKTVSDLKGKLIGMASTGGSQTEWLTRRLAVQEGWGVDGVRRVGLGGFEADVAALKTHNVDAIVAGTEAGLMLEERNEGRILTGFEKYARDYHSLVIFARQPLLQANAALVDRFLKGFFASIAFVKANKAKTTDIAMRVLNQSQAVMDKTYDDEVALLSDDGHFDAKALDLMKDSFVEMGLLATRPTDNELFTAQFLPVKP